MTGVGYSPWITPLHVLVPSCPHTTLWELGLREQMQEISPVVAFAISDQCSLSLSMILYNLSIYILTVLCVCISIYMCIYMYINTCVHACVYVCTCVNVLYMDIHTYIYSSHMCIYGLYICSISEYYIHIHTLITCIYNHIHTHINAADSLTSLHIGYSLRLFTVFDSNN